MTAPFHQVLLSCGHGCEMNHMADLIICRVCCQAQSVLRRWGDRPECNCGNRHKIMSMQHGADRNAKLPPCPYGEWLKAKGL